MTISVIIPTYNRAKEIETSIQSVLTQKYQGEFYNISEIIISDDCSTDNTKEIIQALSTKYPIVKYIKSEENSGPAAARNLGASIATGEWIALLDSDDLWLPNKLHIQCRYAIDHPECAMIYSRMLIYDYENKQHLVPDSKLPINVLEGNIYPFLLQANSVGAPTIMVKREAWNSIGGFDNSFRYIEDWDFAIRISKNYKIGFISEPLIEVHMLDGGISSRNSDWFSHRIRIIVKNKEDLLANGLFNSVVEDLLVKAQKSGVLPQVAKLLEAQLSI